MTQALDDAFLLMAGLAVVAMFLRDPVLQALLMERAEASRQARSIRSEVSRGS